MSEAAAECLLTVASDLKEIAERDETGLAIAARKCCNKRLLALGRDPYCTDIV